MDGEMVLSEIGNYTTEQFRNATTHYPYAEIPLFTIMPNHVHAVVVISPRDVACYVSTTIEERDVARNLQSIGPNNSNEDVARNVSTAQTEKNEYMAERSPKQGSLAVVIRGIKSAVTKHANENDISFAWQPRFHDHIIRNLEELNAIAAYIENNVTNWKDDEFYTH